MVRIPGRVLDLIFRTSDENDLVSSENAGNLSREYRYRSGSDDRDDIAPFHLAPAQRMERDCCRLAHCCRAIIKFIRNDIYVEDRNTDVLGKSSVTSRSVVAVMLALGKAL